MEQTRSMLAVNIAAKLPAHLAIRVLVTAIGTGVVTDQLLRATPWGINLTLSIGAVVLAAAIVTRWGHVQLEGEGRCDVRASNVVLHRDPRASL